MRNHIHIAVIAGLCPLSAAHAGTFYFTDFESPPVTTHANCFNPPSVFPPRPGGSGTHALRYPFPAAPNTSIEEWCHFAAPHREIYMRFWLHVPSNFDHRWQACCGGNNKLFAIWMDGYSDQGHGPTVVWEFWPSETNPGGSDVSVHWSEGNLTGTGLHHSYMPFISRPSDLGRWMQVVFHVKAATNANTRDGVVEMWQRWNSQSPYRKLHEHRDANIFVPASGPNGWKTLYTMGWTNPGYSVATDFYVDDVEISNSAFPDLTPDTFKNGFE